MLDGRDMVERKRILRNIENEGLDWEMQEIKKAQ